MEVIKELYREIRNMLLADATLKDMINNIYFVQAPQEAQLPYVVLNPVDVTLDMTFTEKATRHRMQVSAFAEGSSPIPVMSIMSRVDLLLTQGILIWNSSGGAQYRSVYFTTLITHGPTKEEGKVWGEAIDYEVLVEEAQA